jgi:hypothetical protein
VALIGAAGYGAAWLKFRSVEGGGPYPPGTFRRWELLTDASYAVMAAGAATALVSLVVLGRHAGDGRGAALSLAVSRGGAVGVAGQF